MNPNELQHFEAISNVSRTVGVTLDEAQLILAGRHSELSSEATKKLAEASVEPKDKILLEEIRDLHAKLESIAPVSSLVSPKKSSPAKRTKDKDSTALDAFIRKRLTTPNKELLVLARAKFSKIDISIESLKMRKTRLRKEAAE